MGPPGDDAAGGDAAIVVSPADAKSYRFLTLPNGMSVLLVHDPTVAAALQEETAAAVATAAGGKDVHMRDRSSGDGEAMSGDTSGSGSEDGSSSEDGSGSGSEDGSGSEEGSEGEEGEEEEEGAGGRLGASKKAAAAMAVGVGSFSDPQELQGLSHFLEHMLFMGSEKFPNENEYDSFLTEHGGASNAFTELEFTNYHFEVSPASLEGALDRFAQFFIAPLFQASALEREVCAVDSEFAGVLQSDHSRLAQLMCHTSRRGHIYNKFSWGNKASLWHAPREAGLDVRQAIIDYYRQQYGAERMSLVVLGGQSLDTLQAWVERMFGPIPRGSAGPPRSFDGAGPPFEGRWLYVAPAVKEHHEVTVTFQLPCLRSLYTVKPEHYISHLVGHEGPGSLLSALKARGWALELCAGVDEDGYAANTATYLFTVTIVLTEAGLAAGPGLGLAPVGLLFQYLRLLSSAGPQAWVWHELQAISSMKFRFVEEEDSCDFVTRLASTMGWVEPRHLLVADYLHEAWAPDKVTELLGHMQPGSSSYRIDLLTKAFPALKEQLLEQPAAAAANGVAAAAPPPAQQAQQQQPCLAGAEAFTEPWFQMEALRVPLPAALCDGWAEAPLAPDLALPPQNPYIPSDFGLKGPGPAPRPGPDGGGDAVAAAAAAAAEAEAEALRSIQPWMLAGGAAAPRPEVLLAQPPVMLLDEPGVRLWHKLATGYGQPRLVTYFRLSSPLASASPGAAVLCALWLRLVEEALAEDAYLADVAGLHWSSSPEGAAGFELRVDGFSHKLHLLAARVFECLARCQVKAQSFAAVHEELLRRYRNALLSPAKAAAALRLQLLSGGPHWTHDELADALAQVTDVQPVQAFAAQFMSRCHLEALLLGNIGASEAKALVRSVVDALNSTAGSAGPGHGAVLPAGERRQEVCVQLPPGVALLHEAPARNCEEDNCCVEAYYQIGLSCADLRLRVLTDLVEQVLGEPLYNELRTKQQLGYSVSSGARLTYGVCGFCVVVVSAAYDALEVEARIEAFLGDYQATLQAMPEEEFNRHKAALASNKLQRDTSLGQEGDRAWEQVFNARYEFLAREQEVALLQRTRLADLQAFYATHLAPASPTRRKFCVQVIPSKRKQQQQQPPRERGAGAGAAAAADKQHVRHELGSPRHGAAGHPHEAAAAAGAAAPVDEAHVPPGLDEAEAAAAAAAPPAPPGPGTPRAKRAKAAQQAAKPGGSGAAARVAASVQRVPDLAAAKRDLGRWGCYKGCVPPAL